MDSNRRKVLAGVGTLTALGLGTTQVLGQSGAGTSEDQNEGDGHDDALGPAVSFKHSDPEYEFVVFGNDGSETYDASGYWVDFEYGNDDVDQRRQLPEGSTIDPGMYLYVATGAVDDEKINPGDNNFVEFDYDHDVIADDDSDVIALLDEDGTVVASSDYDVAPIGSNSEDGSSDDSSDDTQSGDDNQSGDDEQSGDDGGSDGSEDTEDNGSDESSGSDSKDSSSEDDSEDGC
ncbi:MULTISPECIES: lamin tail domain-containing protein [unclassified Haladaptatus]|uniref:lamin tail domain-containing protein n=1 Tax=unclassified Haladaptatus TaxID=2622732 RepID=UPI00209BE4B7|nr:MULTISPECIES: lamin tail domain-containing protein [unclassified Haladaptatus]MCO8243612.1 lamin tail domain-containing protein [Haladaptatus sp. AB643]MCO8255021.1 lamin tail domain-containing protein [Haladaptatus sp. AB618]